MVAFLLTHLWQSTLVLLAAWVLARACRRNAAAVRYWIWFVASVKFLVPLAAAAAARRSPRPVPAGTAAGRRCAGRDRERRVRAVARRGDSRAPDAHAVAASTIAVGDLGARRGVAVPAVVAAVVVDPRRAGVRAGSVAWICRCRSASRRATCRPACSASFRPVVILPRAVMQSLTPAQLRAVLAHEVCHVRRHDNLTAAIHHCVQVLFWFYPPVWWIGANLLREREAACDEDVVDEGHERSVYAESILNACRLGVMARLSGRRCIERRRSESASVIDHERGARRADHAGALHAAVRYGDPRVLRSARSRHRSRRVSRSLGHRPGDLRGHHAQASPVGLVAQHAVRAGVRSAGPEELLDAAADRVGLPLLDRQRPDRPAWIASATTSKCYGARRVARASGTCIARC